MELIEPAHLGEGEWEHLTAGEEQPFGAVGASLSWRKKDRLLGLRAPDGSLAALAGAVLASVRVGGGEPFAVVGIGSVIVAPAHRGTGLLSQLAGPLLAMAEGLGPEFAMLFCRPGLIAMYEHLGFSVIAAPVWVDQPQGRVQVAEPAMWRALRAGLDWPPGRVEVEGLPF